PKSVEKASVLHQPDDVGSQRHHTVPIGKLNGVLIALVARRLKKFRIESTYSCKELNCHIKNVNTDDLDAYDSDCDDFSSAKAVLMANLFSYGSDVLSEYLQQTQKKIVQDTNSFAQQDAMIIRPDHDISLMIWLGRPNHDIKGWDLFPKKRGDSISSSKPFLKDAVIATTSLLHLLESEPPQNVTSTELIRVLYIIVIRLDIAYAVHVVSQFVSASTGPCRSVRRHSLGNSAKDHTDHRRDFNFRGRESIKNACKQNDPISKENKINISLINYNELNKLAEDFGKRFVPQMQLSVEQAFGLPLSKPKTEQLVVTQTPIKIKVPKELPKCSVDKKYFDTQNKELSLDNDQNLGHIICQDVMNIVMHDNSVHANVLSANHNCLVDGSLEILMVASPVKKAYRTYNKGTCLIIETTYIDFDELTAMASKQFSSGPGPQLLTPKTISLRLVSYPPSLTLVVSLVPTVVAPRPTNLIGTPSSTTIDQYVPSLSTSQTPQETQSLEIPPDVKEHFYNIKVVHLDNDPFFGVPILEPNSKESSSRDVIPTNVHSVNQLPEHLRK
nr:hypothetical protein [Tanacetum cinerariifolium]